jgi:hypothetical protein
VDADAAMTWNPTTRYASGRAIDSELARRTLRAISAWRIVGALPRVCPGIVRSIRVAGAKHLRACDRAGGIRRLRHAVNRDLTALGFVVADIAHVGPRYRSPHEHEINVSISARVVRGGELTSACCAATMNQ